MTPPLRPPPSPGPAPRGSSPVARRSSTSRPPWASRSRRSSSKIAEDRHYAELIAFRKEKRQAPLEKRLDNIREGLVDELEHALDTGSARGLGWMLREIRLGLQLTGFTAKVAQAAQGGAAPFDWDKTQPDDEPGGPDRDGTHKERFLASLCDADYDDWLAAGRSPYPAPSPASAQQRRALGPRPGRHARRGRARRHARGAGRPATTPRCASSTRSRKPSRAARRPAWPPRRGMRLHSDVIGGAGKAKLRSPPPRGRGKVLATLGAVPRAHPAHYPRRRDIPAQASSTQPQSPARAVMRTRPKHPSRRHRTSPGRKSSPPARPPATHLPPTKTEWRSCASG